MSVIRYSLKAAQALPGPPTSLTSGCMGNQPVASWVAAPGATAYVFCYQPVSGPYSCNNRGPTTCLEHISQTGIIFGSSEGGAYAWWVIPCNDAGCNDAAGQSLPGCPDVVCPTAIPAPGYLQTLCNPDGTITFSWSAVPGIDGYILSIQSTSDPYSCANRGPTQQWRTDASVTSLTLQLPGGSYAWWVNSWRGGLVGPLASLPGCPDVTCFPARFTIQGYKVLGTGQNIQRGEPAESQWITLDGAIRTQANPYLFQELIGNKHMISASPPPEGWKIGYTLCFNRFDCHAGQPISGNSVEFSIPSGACPGRGEPCADLWWHYIPIPIPPVVSPIPPVVSPTPAPSPGPIPIPGPSPTPSPSGCKWPYSGTDSGKPPLIFWLDLANLVMRNWPDGTISKTRENIREVAYAIACAESGKAIRAWNGADGGLWQINYSTWAATPDGCFGRCSANDIKDDLLCDPDCNAHYASQISGGAFPGCGGSRNDWSNVENWNNWPTYSGGAYLKFIPEARQALSQATGAAATPAGQAAAVSGIIGAGVLIGILARIFIP